MSARKDERLVNLLLALTSSKHGITREEIWHGVPQYPRDNSGGAFERQFERDKAELRELGVPIQTRGNTYWVDQDAYADLPDLTAEEIAACELAAQLWSHTPLGKTAKHAVVKLRALGRATGKQANAPFFLAAPADVGVFSSLSSAIEERRVVKFEHRGRQAAHYKTRTVQPWVLTCSAGSWYLTGFDVDRAAPRTYKLDRLRGKVRATGQLGAYDVPADALEQQNLSVPAGEELCVTVEFEPGRGEYFRTLFDVPAGLDVADVCSTHNVLLRDALKEWALVVRVVGDEAAWQRDVVALVADLHEGPPTKQPPEPAESQEAQPDPRTPKVARIVRLLSLVPYVTANPGISTAELGKHFGVPPRQIVADLQLLHMCGRPGQGYEDMIDASWDGGIAFVSNADPLESPLRLTTLESSALTTALSAVAQSASMQGGVVGSALAKLSGSQTVRLDDQALGGEWVSLLREALAQKRVVELEYTAPSSDERSVRHVQPLSLVLRDGSTYLRAYCEKREAIRMFRTDRIATASITSREVTVEEPDVAVGDALQGTQDSVVLRLDPEAMWVLELPGVTDLGEGFARVEVASEQWLFGLLLRLDGAGEIVSPAATRATLHEILTERFKELSVFA